MDGKFYNILGKVLQRTGKISKDISESEAAYEAFFALPNDVFARKPGSLMTNFDRAMAGTIAQEAHDNNPKVIAKAKTKAAGRAEAAANDERRYQKQMAALDAKADEPKFVAAGEATFTPDENEGYLEPNIADFQQAINEELIESDEELDDETMSMLDENDRILAANKRRR